MTDEETVELALLREIRDELRALRLAFQSVTVSATATRERPMPDGELSRLVRLVADINDAIGSRVFTTRELVAHSDQDPELRAALERAFGGFDSRTTKRIGKRLERAAVCTLRGYKVARVGVERNGAVWQIVAPPRVSLPVVSRPVVSTS